MKTTILVEGMEFFAFHGFYEEENRVGCKYSVDLRLQVDFSKAGGNDLLDDTINYEIVYQIVHREMMIVSKLIEHVGTRIITALKAKYPQLENVDLTLYKYNPPLGGQVQRVGITIND